MYLSVGANSAQVQFFSNKYFEKQIKTMAANSSFLWSQAHHEWKHCAQRKKPVTGQYPQDPATGLTAGSIEPAASGSVPLNASSPYLLPARAEPCTKDPEILAKKRALRLWVRAVIRTFFICNGWPHSLFQSLEISQNRNKHLSFESDLLHVSYCKIKYV